MGKVFLGEPPTALERMHREGCSSGVPLILLLLAATGESLSFPFSLPLLFCLCFFTTRVNAHHQLQTLPMELCARDLVPTSFTQHCLSSQLLKSTKWFPTPESSQVLVATGSTAFTGTLGSNTASNLDAASLEESRAVVKEAVQASFPLALQAKLLAGQKAPVWDAKVER